MENQNYIKIDKEAQRHLNAYIDYQMNAGAGDAPFTPEEYEKFKKKQRDNAKNRVFVSWVNSKGRVCKNIGPATKCFCNHRFKDHNYINPKNKKVKCKAKNCKCKCFEYIPVHGSYDFKCLCKHSYRDHDPVTKKCKKCNCSKFESKWSCSCGEFYHQHRTVIETFEERMNSGRPMGKVARMLMDPMIHGKMAGQMTSFMDMVDGAEKFDTKVDEMVERRALGFEDRPMLEDEKNENTRIKPKSRTSRTQRTNQTDDRDRDDGDTIGIDYDDQPFKNKMVMAKDRRRRAQRRSNPDQRDDGFDDPFDFEGDDHPQENRIVKTNDRRKTSQRRSRQNERRVAKTDKRRGRAQRVMDPDEGRVVDQEGGQIRAIDLFRKEHRFGDKTASLYKPEAIEYEGRGTGFSRRARRGEGPKMIGTKGKGRHNPKRRR